jgi:hypothetical protein
VAVKTVFFITLTARSLMIIVYSDEIELQWVVICHVNTNLLEY